MRKPSHQFGDADSYFQKTLRNYDDFDFSKYCHNDFTTFDNLSTSLKQHPEKPTTPISTHFDPNSKNLKNKIPFSSKPEDPKINMSEEENETTEGEDEEIKEVNQIIEKTSQELEMVAEEHQQILQDIENAPTGSAQQSQAAPEEVGSFHPSINGPVQITTESIHTNDLENMNSSIQGSSIRSGKPSNNADIEKSMHSGYVSIASHGQTGSVHPSAPTSTKVSVQGSVHPSQEPSINGSVHLDVPGSNYLSQISSKQTVPVQPDVPILLNTSLRGSIHDSALGSKYSNKNDISNQFVSNYVKKSVAESMTKHSTSQGLKYSSILYSDRNDKVRVDGQINTEIIKELEEAEAQAKATANVIFELKSRVADLLRKEKMTEAEAQELEQKNNELKDQMVLFEKKTRRIQDLIGRTNLIDSMPYKVPQFRHTEDVLPKMILYSTAATEKVPNIILCDATKKKFPPCCPDNNINQTHPIPQFAERLCQSYSMQEKLAAENADLECMRYKLQEDLINKDQTLECLQRKLGNLQNEMRLVSKENAILNDKITKMQNEENYKSKCRTKHPVCSSNTSIGDVATKLQEYSETTYQLEKQLADMECDVKYMQNEINAAQKEREHLKQQRKIMSLPPCSRIPSIVPYIVNPCLTKPTCIQSTVCVTPTTNHMCEAQIREYREMYDRLQDDYKSKLTEVAGLRTNNEKLRRLATEAEDYKKIAEEKIRECECIMKQCKNENNKLVLSKEQIVEQEQQLTVAKQRFREAQDELEELRSLLQDQKEQLDDYRNKYLEAQQQVEEQKRQIDLMEIENTRVNEQVNLEIQRVKNQFQEKLQELTPLPDILKTTQLKLHDAQQMHLMAEKNNESLSQELQMYKDKCAQIATQLDNALASSQLGNDERTLMNKTVQELKQRVEELLDENTRKSTDLMRAEETIINLEKQCELQSHEIAQLNAQLECVREESARQVARIKERCETVRRSMQSQISDMERQLAQSRALARAAQKDRDEIRQKMQAQINNLSENFEDAQGRIRNLQSHVNYLKHSYPSVFADAAVISEDGDICNC